jgi:hypothetical protein
MKELAKDLETLIVKHKWKILSILVVAYFVIEWSDIKSGFIDGWLNK